VTEAMENKSIYHLMSDLCKSLLKEAQVNDAVMSLSRAKSIAFNVLLKEQQQHCDEEHENLLGELQFAAFELSLASKNEKAQHLNQFIDSIELNETLDPLLWILVKTKNITEAPEPSKVSN